MLQCLIFLAGVLGEAPELPIGLITSPQTDSRTKELLVRDLHGLELEVKNVLGFNFKVYWSHLQTEFTLQVPLELTNKQVILDATNDLLYSQFLARESALQGFVHMVVARPIQESRGESPSPNTLYLETSFSSQAYAFIDLIQFYNWHNLGLVYDQGVNNMRLAEVFKNNCEKVYIKDEVVVDSQSDNLQKRLESTTKDSGARVILVFADPTLAARLLQAGSQSVMGGSGYAWILNSEAMQNLGEVAKNSHSDLDQNTFGLLKTGAVGFVQEDSEYLSQEPLGTFRAAFVLVAQAFSKGLSKASEVVEYIKSNPSIPGLEHRLHFDEYGIKKTYYNIYNIKNFVEKKVGVWNSQTRQISMLEQVTWPGFTTTTPDDKTPVLKLALLCPFHSKNGEEFSESYHIKNGFDLALKEINNSTSVLANYKLEPAYLDTFMSKDLSEANLKSVQAIGALGFVGPFDSEVAKAYSEASKKEANPKPIVSYAATATSLNSSELYPNFLRTAQHDGLQAVAVALLIQQQGWNRIGVIYTQDEFGTGIYKSFINNVKTLDISIENEEKYRGIPFDTSKFLKKKSKEGVEAALSEIVRKQLKVVVYLGGDLVGTEVAKVAYKKELYGEEYSWIGGMWLTSELSKYQTLQGAVGLGFRPALGEKGKAFANNYKLEFGKDYTNFAMLAYDTAYLFAYTINDMISKGEDYNDGNQLTEAIRSADFIGASGKVKFNEGSNDRSAFGYSVVNVQEQKLLKVKEYDPSDPEIFKEQARTVWSNGSDNPPKDSWPEEFDCPFAEHMVRVSLGGVVAVLLIGAFMFFLTLGLSVFSYKKWKQVEIQTITEPVVRTWKDTLVEVNIFVEFFQFVAIAPTLESLRIVIETSSNVFMLDIMKVAQGDKTSYWTLLLVICLLCYLWFFLVVMIMTDAEKYIQKLPVLQKALSLLNSVYLPFVGNTLFLPFSALLLDAFVCDHEAQGYSYVWRDCYMNCWTQKHIPYIVMASVALACYEPIAVFSRPLWQQAKTGLNLMIKPLFLLFKTCVQVLLIAVGKSLKGISPISHGVVFSLLCLAFTVVTYKLKPFNYSRCNLWEFSSLLALTFLSVTATVSYFGDPTQIGWFVALAVGWSLIGGVTLVLQKKYYPKLLVPSGGEKSKRKVYDALAVKNFENSELQANSPSPAELSVDDRFRIEEVQEC